MLGIRRKDDKGRKLEKERERRRRGDRKYGQAKLKHSTMGIQSCSYAAAVLIVLILCILIAYVTRGNGAGIIGAAGEICIIITGLGIRAAIKGFRERERNYITCKIGIGANIVAMLLLISIFIGGFL